MYTPPLIRDYYNALLKQLRGDVDSTSDEYVLGVDPEAWTDFLVEKYQMRPIRRDEDRQPTMAEVDIEFVQRRYNIHTDRGPGSRVRSTGVRVEFPVVPSETLREIWKHKLAPNTFSMVVYPEFDYDDSRGVIHTQVGVDQHAVKNAIEQIERAIARYNSSIEDENQQLRQKVSPVVASKVARVKEKHAKLDNLAAAVGIPLTRKVDPATVVPTAPKVRETIVPVMPPPAAKRPERPVLDADKFVAILELIDNQCRGFERTPQSYTVLTEEGLRDIVLGSLNAVFEGAAGGETFQGIGKVDIHLRIAQGEVFMSELKFWGGESSLHETIAQLRGRLTWRDSYGVAVLLSRNVGFSDVLTTAGQAIPKVEGYADGTLRTRATNHFVARFSIPSDPARQAEIHVLIYNLYVQHAGKRQTRRS